MEALSIGGVALPNRLGLAPMAGFGDIALRTLAYEYGAGWATGEMVSCKGLIYRNAQTENLLAVSTAEKPACVQLFGSEPADFAACVSDARLAHFDIIDINMGCPMPKIVREGAGAALLRDPVSASQIVATAVRNTSKPVTVKTRLGWSSADSVTDFVRMCQDSGAAAITLHGRTAIQLYRGVADWEAIARAATAVRIPVIGNGDLGGAISLAEVSDCGVAGFAIGRGAIGNCGLFCEWQGAPAPTKRQQMLRHVELLLHHYGEYYTVTNFRKHFGHYVKGFEGAKNLREQAVKCTEIQALLALIDQVKS